MTTIEEKSIEKYPDIKDIEKRKAFEEGYLKALKEHTFFTIPFKEQISYKPSKEQMHALYKICYITNFVEDDMDQLLINLYQDLKREFFDGRSIENI